MKKLLSILLAMSMALTMLAACANDPVVNPDDPIDPVVDPNEGEEPPVVVKPEYSESEVGAENTLTNAGTTITLNVVDNALYITNLATTASNVNQLAENSKVALPASYQEKEKGSKKNINWTYVSTTKYENKEVNDVLTSGVIYKFEDSALNVELRVYCLYRNDHKGPFEFYSELENKNDSAFRIAPGNVATFTVSVPEPENTSIMYVKQEGMCAEGFKFSATSEDSYDGTGIYSKLISEMRKMPVSIKTSTDDSSGDSLLAEYINRNNNNGLFYAFEWTSGSIKVVDNKDNTIEVSIHMDGNGMIPYFSTEIPGKETFYIPAVYVMPYEGSVDEGSNIFKNWFFDCKVVPTLRDNPAEPFTQIDIQMSAEDAAAANIDSMKYEYGWWSGVGFGSGLGNPYESSWVMFADGLDSPNWTYSDLVARGEELDSYGLNLTMYILLHDSTDYEGNPTDQYGELNSLTHPEWFSHELSHGNKLVDLGNEAAVDFVKTKLSGFFNNTHADTWRTDFQPIVAMSNQKNRHDAMGSDVQYWATVGFGEVLDHLYETVDGFRYECCDGGGKSKDLYIATKAVVINVEDSANYLSMRAAFYDSSYVIHPAQLQIPCNTDSFNPDNETYFFPVIPEPVVDEGETYDFYSAVQDMGFRTTIMGVPHWAPWSGQVKADYYKKYCDMYELKVRPLVREAELYHILPRPDGVNWDGMMYADPDSENEIKGLVFLFKPSEQT
ncbi:MAG: alpha-galactosidase, partial [Clostridia bacterium]|nr:alpha-galactosidase [Clostridia bacterium]